MSDSHNTGTVSGAAASVGRSLISALPPAFLMLVLINAAFLGCVMWFVDHQLTERTKLMEAVVDRCFTIALQANPPKP
jgi:hypothetical protein